MDALNLHQHPHGIFNHVLNALQKEHCLASIDDDFSIERFSACAGTSVGAVRASFGMATSEEDVRRALEVLASFRSVI